MRTKEQIIFERNSALTNEKLRCWGCKKYVLNRDGSASCTFINKHIRDISDKECALDGSQRR